MLKQKGLRAIIISLLVILSSTCFSLLFVNAYTSFSEQEKTSTSAWNGSGTSSSPYLIESKSDLQNW